MFTRGWDDLVARDSGPFHGRLILQPLVAALLAIRSGWKDARERRPVFFWTVVRDSTGRRSLLREGWKDLRRILLAAVVLDVGYQMVVLRWFFPVQTLIVATVLAIIPYLIFRGVTNRIMRETNSRAQSCDRGVG